jgi:hypothetical protein
MADHHPPAPARQDLERTYRDWEFGLTGYCVDNDTGIEQLPSELVQAWEDMNAAWSDIKDHAGNVPDQDRERFQKANDRMDRAWSQMTDDSKTG